VDDGEKSQTGQQPVISKMERLGFFITLHALGGRKDFMQCTFIIASKNITIAAAEESLQCSDR